MSEMYNVSVSDYAQFDSATALRRCLARGLVDAHMLERLAGFDEWIELRFSVTNCHPDSRCGTSEELFLRLIADANMQVGEKYQHTPVDKYYDGKLFTMGFQIKEAKCPLAILELKYTPGAPKGPYAGGEDDAVDALVLFPKQFAPNIADVGYFDSASWGGARRLDDVARGARWARKRGEIRLISASRRLLAKQPIKAFVDGKWKSCGKGPGFDMGMDSLCLHAGSLYAVSRHAKVKGPTRLDGQWNPTIVDTVERPISFECVHSDGDSLWVGGTGLHQLRDDAVVNSFDIKTGLTGKDVKALTHTSDGTLVVAGSAGFTLIRDGAVVESVKDGVGLKSIRNVAAAPTGELWFGGLDGATRRNPDGSFDTFKVRQHVASVTGLVCLADGSTLIGVQYPAPTTLHVAQGSQRTKPFEPVCDFGCIVGGFEHGGAQWVVTEDGTIARIVDGEPVRAFVLDNIERRGCSGACLIDGVVYLYGHACVSMVETSTLEAALKRPADNVAIHGKRGLVSVHLSEYAGAPAAIAAPAIDIEGKKICITGTFSRLDRADVSVKLGALGASVVSGVTKATQILFAGAKAGSKLAKAKDLGIPIYGEDELLALVSAPAAAAVEAVKVEKPQPKADAAPNPFNGKKVVVTGTMQTMTRADIGAKLAELGASVPGSISAKTDFLIVGTGAGSKLAKAKSLGVAVYTEDEFIALIEGGGAKPAAAKPVAAVKPKPAAAAKPKPAAAAKKTAPAAAKQKTAKPAASKSASTFAGKLVVVTGTMQTMTRASVTARLEALGAKVGGSVTAKTDLLVVGLKAGSKLAKAKSLGVQVMTEDAFIDLVGE